jgi:hypothetical protein
MELSGSAAGCSCANSSVWQCARQCAAVRLVVYGSARGSVRLSGSAAVCGSKYGNICAMCAVRGVLWVV